MPVYWWFAFGWVSMGLLVFFSGKVRAWLRKRRPCPNCNGAGYISATTEK